MARLQFEGGSGAAPIPKHPLIGDEVRSLGSTRIPHSGRNPINSE